MDKIVIELQRNVLDSNSDILTLLRQAYLIAKKLKLVDFENWVSSELNGYAEDSPLPSYRKIWGELKAMTPHNGWQPVLISDIELNNLFNRRYLRDPISRFSTVLNAGQEFALSISGPEWEVINKLVNAPFQTKYAIFLNHNTIHSVIEIVKNSILDWAILLEENGVVGEGLTFSKQEKEKAQIPQIIYYTNNFYEDATNIEIQQGTKLSKQGKGERL